MITGDNDLSCGSSCTTTGAATDGFACVLAANGIPAAPQGSTFGYTTSHFTASSYTPPSGATTNCNATYSSTMHKFTTGSCTGTAPTVESVAQSNPTGGPAVDILLFSSLTIANGSTLTLIGTSPVILAVYGNVVINGTIDASGSGTIAGAGGDNASYCTAGAAATGGVNGASGGGGGGKVVAGGAGSCGGQSCGTNGTAIAGGGTNATELAGGCVGTTGECGFGGCGLYPAAAGGVGGGAVEIAAAGTVTGSGGLITANGAAGGNGGTGQNGAGGGGGGSGGEILIYGTQTSLSGITLAANGGAGGSATDGTTAGGTNNWTTQVAPASATLIKGGTGINEDGSGGGGAYGYVTVTNSETSSFVCATTLSPQPVSNAAHTACLCVADSDCPSGKCSNVNSQCTGTCSGTTTASTYDVADCQLLTSY
jgi:hypothetical protein